MINFFVIMPLRYRLSPDRLFLFGLAISTAVYCRDLRYDFILDDLPLILLNDTISSWRNWKLLFTTHIFSAQSTAMLTPGAIALHYRPVYMLWLMANNQLFGANTPWLHLTSILLHLLVVFFVYKLAEKMLENPWAAVLAALLFAFHPLHAESVAYISSCSDLLATLFLLISLLGYLRFREKNQAFTLLLLSMFSAALAILSKENAAVFPWILVAFECFRPHPQNTALWKRFVWTLPYFAVVAAYSAVRAALFGGSLLSGPASHHASAVWSMPLLLLVYLRNLVFPVQLSIFYPTEWTSQWTISGVLGLLFALGVTIWLWRLYRDSSLVRLQIVWTAVFFLPALTAVFLFANDDWVHDRHMYLVSVPFCILMAALLTHSALGRSTSLAVSTAVLLILPTLTFLQVSRFQNELTLYGSALKVAPQSATLHGYYALSLLNYGRTDEALQAFRNTILLTPNSPTAHESYAAALLRFGREDEAAAEFRKALLLSPSPTPFRASLLYRLATIELDLSNSVDAVAHLREAIQIDPKRLNYHGALASALRGQGHIQEADAELLKETTLRELSLRGNSTPARSASRP